MDFSIIIPAYNEKTRLPSFLSGLVRSIVDSRLDGEMIIVDDGSDEENYRACAESVNRITGVPARILRHQKNTGKGAAIKTGFMAAKGEWIGFADADGATSPEEVVRLLKTALCSASLDGVFGARVRMLGYDIDRRFSRHLSGRIFTTLAYLVNPIPFYDSQCGCKFFRRATCLRFIEMCREKQWLFDIEIISIGYFNNLKFLEVPISWRDMEGSKVHLVRDSFRMAVGVWKMKKRLERAGVLEKGLQRPL